LWRAPSCGLSCELLAMAFSMLPIGIACAGVNARTWAAVRAPRSAAGLGEAGVNPVERVYARVNPANRVCRFPTGGGASSRAARLCDGAHSDQEKSFSTSAGMERTLGVCHAVETRSAPDGMRKVCVISVLTTATTRPSQSSTGAPEAP